MTFSSVTLHTSVTLDASPKALWPLLSDTSRVNRLIGLPASKQVEPGSDESQIIHSHYFGTPVSWREAPFQWAFEQWFESHRSFFSPMPIEDLITSTRLVPVGERTRVDVEVRLTNRNVLGWLAGRLVVANHMMREMVRVYRLLATTARVAGALPPPVGRPPEINEARLSIGLQRLAELGAQPALTEQLGNHLRHAEDEQVVKMRPFVLARHWGADRMDVLRLCLLATRSGLLELEWDVICPSCRGANNRLNSLNQLPTETHCAACNIRYDLNFDEAVELRFSVNPDLREANDSSFCIGGPANTRHILAQLRIPAGHEQELRVWLEPGTYRLRTRQFTAQADFQVAEGQHAGAVTFTIGAHETSADTTTLAPGDCLLRFVNTSDADQLLLIEDQSWNSEAASAALVTALEEFRNLFSSEVLAPGVNLAIKNLAFLFTDLKGSTTIYDTIGDAPAYARVRDHFTAMRQIIDQHQGALVKTIGDAVMAVFPSAEQAMRSAIDMQDTFINGEIGRGTPMLQVKIGLHRGPCIAVNANNVLDYFGSTVNAAARIQGESTGGDIVFSQAIAEDPGVQQLLAEQSGTYESFDRALRGLRQGVKLHRIQPHPLVPADL